MTRHTFADSPRLAELLARYHLGMIAPKAAARLAAIFEAPPADALERLARACDHLGVTGDQAAELVARAHAAGPRMQAPPGGSRINEAVSPSPTHRGMQNGRLNPPKRGANDPLRTETNA
jgi:hypothetical protein